MRSRRPEWLLFLTWRTYECYELEDEITVLLYRRPADAAEMRQWNVVSRPCLREFIWFKDLK